MLRTTRTVGEAGQSVSTGQFHQPHVPTPLADPGDVPARRMTVVRRSAVLAAAVVLAALWPLPARVADEVVKQRWPRTSVEIGGVSVVLVAAIGKLYAFVDRLDDNAPVVGARLAVSLANGVSLKLSRLADGLFVAPFNRIGHTLDFFLISLASPDGSGDMPAEIGYDDAPVPAVRFEPRNASAGFLRVAGAETGR